MVKVENLVKNYRDFCALNNINLCFEEGKTTALIGPSGSGKSTFLRCLNLLEVPQKGTLTIGKDSITFSEKEFTQQEMRKIRLNTGMVFQNFNLFPHKTVLENVIEGPTQVLKKSKGESIELANELLEKVGLSDKRDSYPNMLSGGQQQRVAIARTLAMKPQVLLFDEPTSALDPELELEVLKVIENLSREGNTMLVVTHNMQFARSVAQRIVFFDNGEVRFSGTPSELFSGLSNNKRIDDFLSTNYSFGVGL